MLTPVFELVDQPNHLRIIIKAPYTKVSDAEVFIDGCEFKFYSKPYYLRLNLPGSLLDSDGAEAKYDADSGTFTITASKETPGQPFEGLDMLTKLLAPVRQKESISPGIEVIGETPETPAACSSQLETCEENVDSDKEFDWQIEQEVCEERTINLDAPHYGFGAKKSGVFRKLQEELSDVIDLREADSILESERQALRFQNEQDQFDEEYYMADLFQNDCISDLLQFTPPWSGKSGQKFEFSDTEKEQLVQLPRREYLLGPSVQQSTLLGLVDILFSYAYNYRTTEGENTVESAWTICKLSATLSWLQTYTNLQDVAVTCYRRALCYPLYRHWELTETVMSDVKQIITLGQRMVLRCLLDIHKLLLGSENYYLLNDLYITDYCVWIQSVKDKHLRSLAENLSKVKVNKATLQFDLDIIEQAGKLALQEEELKANAIVQELDSLSVQQEGIKINDTLKVKDDSESSDSSSDSSETDSSTESDSSSEDCDDDDGAKHVMKQSEGHRTNKLITEISDTLREQKLQENEENNSVALKNTAVTSFSLGLKDENAANSSESNSKNTLEKKVQDLDKTSSLSDVTDSPNNHGQGEKCNEADLRKEKGNKNSTVSAGAMEAEKDHVSLNF